MFSTIKVLLVLNFIPSSTIALNRRKHIHVEASYPQLAVTKQLPMPDQWLASSSIDEAVQPGWMVRGRRGFIQLSLGQSVGIT